MTARFLTTIVLCLTSLQVTAQDSLLHQSTAADVVPWEEVFDLLEMLDDDGKVDDASWSDETFEWLEQLAEAPLDLNTASREELERLPFLSDQQVCDFIEYRDRYGPIRSMGELRMVRSMDWQQIRLLPLFVAVSEVQEQHTLPTLKEMLRYGRHSLTASARLPLYSRKGDDNGYLGYKYRHWTKYEYSYGQNLKIGLAGAQDSGEPFFAHRNRWGYDAYTYYAQIGPVAMLQNAVVGKYRLSAGMGLVMNTSFSLGKQTTLQSLGRPTRTLRAHTSRTEADYFQGAAATLRPLHGLDVTLFGSYRAIDATLTDDGDARTLITNGYHRTPAEMEKKYNTHLSALGTSVSYRLGALRLGANAVYSHLDRSLEPDRQTLYRRYNAHGHDFFNASADYHLTYHHFSLHGETALNDRGALATINALSFQPASSLSLVALQRFYSYRYTTLHGHCFSEFGHVQNESGIYLGANWTPLRYLHLQVYADYAYAPWARYLVSQSSHAWDWFAQATYERRRWSVQLRYRAHLRQRDNEDKTALMPYDNHTARLTLGYTPTKTFTAKTQLSASRAVYRTTDRGIMLSQQVVYQQGWLQLSAMGAYFNTDSYQSRIYVYERQLPGNFSFPTYYGEGLRLACTARFDLSSHLRLHARLGYTNYFDRSTIGTGLQQISASHLTDIDLQLRWRF